MGKYLEHVCEGQLGDVFQFVNMANAFQKVGNSYSLGWWRNNKGSELLQQFDLVKDSSIYSKLKLIRCDL